MDVVVSTKGSPEGRGGFQWTRAANSWAQAVGPPVRDAIRKRAPVGKGPGAGKLRDRIRARTSGSSGAVRAEFIAYVPYAGYVRDGTRAHVIVPRNASVLRFTSAAGSPVFAHRVNHPGTKPNPFAKDAVVAQLPMVRAAFTDIMRTAMGGKP